MRGDWCEDGVAEGLSGVISGTHTRIGARGSVSAALPYPIGSRGNKKTPQRASHESVSTTCCGISCFFKQILGDFADGTW